MKIFKIDKKAKVLARSGDTWNQTETHLHSFSPVCGHASTTVTLWYSTNTSSFIQSRLWTCKHNSHIMVFNKYIFIHSVTSVDMQAQQSHYGIQQIHLHSFSHVCGHANTTVTLWYSTTTSSFIQSRLWTCKHNSHIMVFNKYIFIHTVTSVDMQTQQSHYGIQQPHLHSFSPVCGHANTTVRLWYSTNTSSFIQSRLWTCKHNSHIMVFNKYIFIHTVTSVDMQAQQSHYGIQQIHLHSFSHVCGHASTTVTLWYSTNTSSFIQSRLWTCKHNSHIMVFNNHIFIHSVPSVDMQTQQSHYGIQQIHLHSFSPVCGHANTTVTLWYSTNTSSFIQSRLWTCKHNSHIMVFNKYIFIHSVTSVDMQAQQSHYGIQQIHLHSYSHVCGHASTTVTLWYSTNTSSFIQSRLWTCKHNSHIMVFNKYIFIHTVTSVDMQAQQSHYGIQQPHLHSFSPVCGHANTTVTLWYSTNTSSFIQSRLWTCKHNSHIMVFNKYIFIHTVTSVDMQAQQSHYGIQQPHLHSFSPVCGHASTTVTLWYSTTTSSFIQSRLWTCKHNSHIMVFNKYIFIHSVTSVDMQTQQSHYGIQQIHLHSYSHVCGHANTTVTLWYSTNTSSFIQSRLWTCKHNSHIMVFNKYIFIHTVTSVDMQTQQSHYGIQQPHLHSFSHVCGHASTTVTLWYSTNTSSFIQSRLWTCKHNSHIMVFNNHIFIHSVTSVDMQAQQSHYGIQQIHLHSYSHVCGHASTTVTLWYSTTTSSFIQSRLWTCKHNSHIMAFNKYIFIHTVTSVDMQAQQSHYGIQQIHLHSYSHVCGHANTTVTLWYSTNTSSFIQSRLWTCKHNSHIMVFNNHIFIHSVTSVDMQAQQSHYGIQQPHLHSFSHVCGHANTTVTLWHSTNTSSFIQSRLWTCKHNSHILVFDKYIFIHSVPSVDMQTQQSHFGIQQIHLHSFSPVCGHASTTVTLWYSTNTSSFIQSRLWTCKHNSHIMVFNKYIFIHSVTSVDMQTQQSHYGIQQIHLHSFSHVCGHANTTVTLWYSTNTSSFIQSRLWTCKHNSHIMVFNNHIFIHSVTSVDMQTQQSHYGIQQIHLHSFSHVCGHANTTVTFWYSINTSSFIQSRLWTCKHNSHIMVFNKYIFIHSVPSVDMQAQQSHYGIQQIHLHSFSPVCGHASTTVTLWYSTNTSSFIQSRLWTCKHNSHIMVFNKYIFIHTVPSVDMQAQQSHFGIQQPHFQANSFFHTEYNMINNLTDK